MLIWDNIMMPIYNSWLQKRRTNLALLLANKEEQKKKKTHDCK